MTGWDDLYADEFWAKWADRPPLQITLDWFDSLRECGAKRVYDMGCGVGRHTVLLTERGFSVVASDISAPAREATRRKLESNRPISPDISNGPRHLAAEIIDADMTSIPYPDAYFDGVLSIGVMEHNTRAGIENAIAEIFRTLRPGGKVLASFCPRHRWMPKDDPKTDMIEDNTLRSYGPEKAIHHLVDEEELRGLFSRFVIRSISLQTEKFERGSSAELFISAEKPK